MKKIEMKDVSVLIPMRLDSLDRLDNLLYVVNYLIKYFDINVYVLHADRRQHNYLARLMPEECNYTFMEDIDPIFHRTRYINMLYRMCKSPILAIWDADVILAPNQVEYAVNSLRYNDCEVCFPYDGKFLNVDPILKDCFESSQLDVDLLIRNQSKMNVLYNNIQNGGAFFISKEAFLYSKGENVFFYGWGPEDWNRLEKWRVLGYRIIRSQGPLFHLHHSRDINGDYSSYFQRKNCQSILSMTQVSSSDMLSDIQTAPNNVPCAESLFSIINS